jgi:hypothetical protein
MCGTRLYSDWVGSWGRLKLVTLVLHGMAAHKTHSTDGVPRKIPGAGALFPQGYLPRVRDPEPWICPVRDCQTIFPDAWALGGHFSVSGLWGFLVLGVFTFLFSQADSGYGNNAKRPATGRVFSMTI